MSGFELSNDETVDGIKNWFSQFGVTDVGYLSAHWNRFAATRDFALYGIEEKQSLTVLDVGTHWLHNAFFYANKGHKLICVDAPDLIETENVKRAAAAMGAHLRATRRLEKADGFTDIPENTIDLMLFCEIIEHLAFNPIPFWKEVYRILKPGGRIIVTTPNAFYFKSIEQRLQRILDGECFGLSVNEIFRSGTYGHHWKEFSLEELQLYFTTLSSDFDVSRYQMIYHKNEQNAQVNGSLEALISSKTNTRAYNIYIDVRLSKKEAGIQINPPWIPA